jgi:Domain of unknown function (DUF4148)
MNAKLALSSLVLAAFAGSALAEGPIQGNEVFAGSAGMSRAEVQADLVAFQRSGANPWADSYDQLRDFQGTATRGQVTAEFIASRTEVAALNGEDSGSMYIAQLRTPAPATVVAKVEGSAE